MVLRSRVHFATLLLSICAIGFLLPDRLAARPPDCWEEDCEQPSCGDAICGSGESCSSCPDDCGICSGPICGNAACEAGESCSTCSMDCGTCATCGDQICQGGEDCATCAGDCGACSVCGDGICSGEDCGTCSQDCGTCARPGYWNCATYWSAYTTDRTMQGTHLECGWFTCSDRSHTTGRSWVDIVGGVSQTCEDNSTSFYGPLNGEWDMCDQSGFANQRSTGQQWITGVNQAWERFPQIGGCPPPPVVHMDRPFMSIYDLDYCFIKQIAGTINFSNFPLYATRLSGDCDDPYSNTVRYAFTGGDSVQCCGGDGPYQHCEGGCTNNKLCSDLQVVGSYTCTWYEPPPCRPRYDSCEPNDVCCDGGYCHDGICW